MACTALKNSAEDLSFASELLEMLCGVEGWGDSVGYGISACFGGVFPVLLPHFDYGAFGSAFRVGSCRAEGDLAA